MNKQGTTQTDVAHEAQDIQAAPFVFFVEKLRLWRQKNEVFRCKFFAALCQNSVDILFVTICTVYCKNI